MLWIEAGEGLGVIVGVPTDSREGICAWTSGVLMCVGLVFIRPGYIMLAHITPKDEHTDPHNTIDQCLKKFHNYAKGDPLEVYAFLNKGYVKKTGELHPHHDNVLNALRTWGVDDSIVHKKIMEGSNVGVAVASDGDISFLTSKQGRPEESDKKLFASPLVNVLESRSFPLPNNILNTPEHKDRRRTTWIRNSLRARHEKGARGYGVNNVWVIDITL